MFSVHGLVRGHNLELGRDADTGGQITYVVELARALAEHPDVDRLDLITREVIDPKIDDSYTEGIEELAPATHIVRLRFGPQRYLRKERLWPHLQSCIDQALQHFRRVGRAPDVIHGHYADAGHVGANLASLLGVPFVFTGHSLGRVKRKRLLSSGATEEQIEKKYNISRRIEAEEFSLDCASMVVVSTTQEIEEQYAIYDNHRDDRMRVIRPGVDLSRFSPPRRLDRCRSTLARIERFLREPRKPIILALSRPDPRKNVAALVRAYGELPELRERANLVLVLGNRDNIESLDRGARDVLNEVLHLVDRYDLYGHVAYPKHHDSEEVPDFYRIATRSKGVFVNPALTEPFGLTLLEAAASGVPVVATNDGGPRDILAECDNGILVDPLDETEIGNALLAAVSDLAQWRQWSSNGLKGARRFGWQNHAKDYVRRVKKLVRRRPAVRVRKRGRLVTADRALVTDIDNTLVGDRDSVRELFEAIGEHDESIAFGVATGRNIESARRELKRWGVPEPDVLVTSVGSEIYYGPEAVPDRSWSELLDYRWSPDGIRSELGEVPGLRLQEADGVRSHKISYDVDPEVFPGVREASRRLRRHDLHARIVYSHRAYLDALPIRASKGHALRHLSAKWGISLARVLVAGDSGNDEEMLRGDTLGVVVGNFSPELERLRGLERIYFADAHFASGILEGLEHYDFWGTCAAPIAREVVPG